MNAQVDSNQKQERIEEKEVYEDVDGILSKTVDEIWEMFDDDGNGTFDIDETTAFIKHTLTEMGENPEYSEQDFLQCFTQFGPKGRGYITKTEMMIFIKKVAGIDTKADEGYLKMEENEEQGEGSQDGGSAEKTAN